MDTFKVISGHELTPLKIRKDIGKYDREISFIKELNSCFSIKLSFYILFYHFQIVFLIRSFLIFNL